MQHALDFALGSSAETMTWSQMTLRAMLIFVYGVVVFRFAYRRFFGQSTDFDIVVVVRIGSAMSRTLTGNAPLLPTLAATTTLVALHGALALMAWRWPLVGWLIKGSESRLIERGRMDRRAMLRSGVTEHDLLEAIRLKGSEGISNVEVAVLERSGKISVILRR